MNYSQKLKIRTSLLAMILIAFLNLFFNNCSNRQLNIDVNSLNDKITTPVFTESNTLSETTTAQNAIVDAGGGTGNGSGYDGKLMGLFILQNSNIKCEGVNLPQKMAYINNLGQAKLVVNEEHKCGAIIDLTVPFVFIDDTHISIDGELYVKAVQYDYVLSSTTSARCYSSEKRNFFTDVFMFRINFNFEKFNYFLFLQNANGKHLGSLTVDQMIKNENKNTYQFFPYELIVNKQNCTIRKGAIPELQYYDCPGEFRRYEGGSTYSRFDIMCSYYIDIQKLQFF